VLRNYFKGIVKINKRCYLMCRKSGELIMKKVMMNNGKKGFTLVEVIVVLVILAILAAIIVPSGIGYIKTAKQNARTETARAIFNLAQNAMTSLYAKGDEENIVADGKVDVNSIDPAINSKEATNNKDNIRYIFINKTDSNRKDNPVYKLLDGYISDNSILEKTILIEYNIKTGKVLSTFYSEVRNNIGYTNDSEYNVYTRNTKTLKENETGYWAVDSTGTVKNSGLDDISATLVDYDGSGNQGNNINNGNNYGLLVAEFVLPDTLPEAYDYDITLNPEKGTAQTIEIGGGKTIEWKDINSSLASAINGNGFYLDKGKNGENLLVLILDTPYQNYSINKKFPSIGIGNLTVSMKASIESDNKTVSSGAEHAYFDSEENDGGNTKYKVASIRHLNNVRYDTTKTAEYFQIKDIKCRDYKDDILMFEPIGNKLLSDNNTGYGNWWDSDVQGFDGTYKGYSDNKTYVIYDLTVDENDKAGLFAQVNKTGVVNGVTVDYTDNYWDSYNSASNVDKAKYFVNATETWSSSRTTDTVAGIIAAENNGGIYNCTVSGKVSVDGYVGGYNEGFVGGITGRNNWLSTGAEIKGCMSSADVDASSSSLRTCNAGGIAGYSIGSVTYCEVGTASKAITGGTKIIGTPYFGANINRPNCNYSTSGIANDVVKIEGSYYGVVGGIVGACGEDKYGNKTEITYCVNAAHVVKKPCYLTNSITGGIVGYSWGGNFEYCYNAGTIDNGYMTGGIVGYARYGYFKNCYNNGNIINNERYGGGVVGNSEYVKFEYCYSTGTCSTARGGFQGDTKGNSILKGCAFLKNNINRTTNYWIDLTMCTEEQLKMMHFKGMHDADTSGVGQFNYPYPYIDINNSECELGSDFHRTPWE